MKMEMLMEMTMVARLGELGKPATFTLCVDGGDPSRRAVVHAINAARLFGRAALHAEDSSVSDNPNVLSLKRVMEEVRAVLAVHELHEGELTAEAGEPRPRAGGGKFCRIDVVCTDHPTQLGRSKQDAPPTERKSGGDPPIDPNLPGYR